MSVDFEEKFRSEGLDRLDEPEVLKAILETGDTSKLLSYLYIYGYSFDENEEVLNICKYYIENPIPGLTAVCMRVAIDDWNKSDRYYNILEKFLNIELFDEWYDEIIFTINFINRNKDAPFSTQIMNKFADIIANPQISSLEILKPYRRRAPT